MLLDNRVPILCRQVHYIRSLAPECLVAQIEGRLPFEGSLPFICELLVTNGQVSVFL